MDPLLSGYALVFGVILLVWLGITLFVILTRSIYDGRLALVRLADRLAQRRLRTSGDQAMLEAAIAKIPRRTLERLAADEATAPVLATVLARHAVERRPQALLREGLAHTNEVGKWRRVRALRILARAGADGSLRLLAHALADRDEDVVAAAVTTLAEVEDPQAGALLVGALRDGVTHRSRVATQIDLFPLPLDHLLMPLLRARTNDVRYWAVKLLARYPDLPQLPAELTDLSSDRDPAVRAAVAETIGVVGGHAASSVGRVLLEDPVPFVRAHAARALAGQTRRELAEPVAALLADGNWWVRNRAKRALESLGHDAAAYVIPHLESPDEFARNGAAEVLQNTGYVDDLVAGLTREPHDLERRRTLRLVVAAGGEEYSGAVVARADGREERVQLLLASDAQ